MVYIIALFSLVIVDASNSLSSFLSIRSESENSLMFLQAEEDTDIAFELDAEMALVSLNFYIDVKEDELVDVKNDIVDIKTDLEKTEVCADNTNCAACTLNSGCVWCPSLNTCEEGDEEGTDEQNCEDFEYGYCVDPDCDAYASCDVCINNASCGWCGDSSTCVLASDEECSELYELNSDTDNYCPEESTDENYVEVASTDSELEDSLGELELKQADLEGDIDGLYDDKENIKDIINSYPD